ncbi:hypothetical protein ACFQ1S_09690 [Kibdelosporangium lantanae]|uniref:Uncharacterized protein n=1 Tax=Kibdelosporangium lantanae TaxID=1497396 RepID=A0ABW3M5A0_9PSEU
MLLVTSNDDAPTLFRPLPARTVDRSAAYQALLQALLDLVGADSPPMDEADARMWRHRARYAVGKAVIRRAAEAPEATPMPEEWFEPLIRAAVHEPDPSFNKQLIEPAITALGRRRVQLALINYLHTGTAPDIAGAARAWYWTQVPLTYLPSSDTPTPESLAEYEAFDDLRQRYRHTALRQFVTVDDLDVRRCILPGLPLDPTLYPTEMHDLVAHAVRIARTSSDEYLRHRVVIQAESHP